MEHSGMSAHHCPACQAYLAGIRYQAAINRELEDYAKGSAIVDALVGMAGGGGSDGTLSPDKPATATTPKPMPANTLKPAKPTGLPTLPGW